MTQGGIFVRQRGSGPPLVLLHGLLVSGEMFGPLVAEWSPRYRLIVPDLRGHGRSAQLPGPYTVGQLATDVADMLDRMHVPRAHVLGLSHGGAVAQQLARDHPDRVDRLVLAGTFAYNLLTRRERVEARLSSWLLGTVGPAAMTGLVIRGGGGPRISAGQAATLRLMLGAIDRRRAVAAHRAMVDPGPAGARFGAAFGALARERELPAVQPVRATPAMVSNASAVLALDRNVICSSPCLRY
jgi:3-oxoadipate enol-lactonase